MEILTLFSVTLFIFSVTHTVLCVDVCDPISCSPTGPTVRFPFRLIGRQPRRCGYPGFDLSCNNKSQLLLNLPLAGEFIVNDIDYISQTIIFKPEFCPVDRFDTSNSVGSPFDIGYLREYTFFNCSSELLFPVVYPFEVLDCFSGGNTTVVTVPTRIYNGFGDRVLPEFCLNDTGTAAIPVGFRWGPPFCGRCERENRACGFKDVDTLEIGCSGSSKSGLSTAAKYGIIVGAGLPGLLLLLCLANFVRKKYYYRTHQIQRHVPNFPITTTITPQHPMFVMGLDKLTIESYPVTVLGESKRLPKASDSTCAICLSEYQPNDTLRTVPECNHYFHSNCIDEWLKLNATCPVCRNSPEGSSSRTATPMSSSSSSTSIFSN